MALAPGAQLGRYEIVEPIGAAGMGEVYRSRDTTLEPDVAANGAEKAEAAYERRTDLAGNVCKTTLCA
jgi:hypothetical protein